MKRLDVVKQIVPPLSSSLQTASAFAPANIALCKYWGKRDSELNLPMTSSLSVSLGDKGTCTKISVNDQDKIILNGDMLSLDLPFAKRLIAYLDLFRTQDHLHFSIETTNNIPTGAGVASSASGFAALVLALDKLFQWQLDKKYLSILARLGSGSACRSLWQGFVKWHVGVRVDGMDSVAEPLSIEWPNFRMGLLIFSEKEKSMGSREAMQRVVATSRFYKEWPAQVADDLNIIEQALSQQDFDLLGKTAESNALAMHATLLTAQPPISYYLPETIAAMQRVWRLRAQGVSVYFTQDAGPNLKLLFLSKDEKIIKENFSNVEVIQCR